MGLSRVEVGLPYQNHNTPKDRPMTTTTPSISPLRQRMIDDMTMRKLRVKTQEHYIRAVKNFTRFYGRTPRMPKTFVASN